MTTHHAPQSSIRTHDHHAFVSESLFPGGEDWFVKDDFFCGGEVLLVVDGAAIAEGGFELADFVAEGFGAGLVAGCFVFFFFVGVFVGVVVIGGCGGGNE